jgi:hypothetical protein
MGLRAVLTRRTPRSGRLEGCTTLIQAPSSVGSVSSVVNLSHDVSNGTRGEWLGRHGGFDDDGAVEVVSAPALLVRK